MDTLLKFLDVSFFYKADKHLSKLDLVNDNLDFGQIFVYFSAKLGISSLL